MLSLHHEQKRLSRQNSLSSACQKCFSLASPTVISRNLSGSGYFTYWIGHAGVASQRSDAVVTKAWRQESREESEMFVPVLLTRAIKAAVPVVVKQIQQQTITLGQTH